jgi:hypothetical protein
VPEEFALHDAVHEGADAVPSCAGAGDNALDRGPIAEVRRGAGREHEELAHQIAREVGFALAQQPLEFADVAEGPAVRKFAGGIDRQPKVEGERLAVLPQALQGRRRSSAMPR